MIDIEVTQDIQDSRLSLWNSLLDSSANPLPFQRYEWVKECWKNFAKGSEKLFIILASKGNELIGIAPLIFRKNNWPGYSTISFIGTGYFDYFDFIIKRGEEKDVIISFIDYINKNFANFELQLKNIFRCSATFSALMGELDAKRLKGLVFREDLLPTIELTQTKEQFYPRIKKSLKKVLTRRERRLKELGKLEFKECNTLDKAKDALEDFFSLHIKKWENSSGYSGYKFFPRREFLRKLLNALFEKNIVNLYCLSLNNRNLDICFAFKLNKRFIYYSATYDPEYAKYAPAQLMINRLIDFSIENQFKEFDFGIGNEPYKLDWPAKTKELSNIYIFGAGNFVLGIFLKLSRYIIGNYFLYILPFSRKFSLAVYLWRWANRKRGRYQRFE